MKGADGHFLFIMQFCCFAFMLAMTAFTLMTRRGICEMQNVAPDGKGIRLELIGFRGNETIPDTLH